MNLVCNGAISFDLIPCAAAASIDVGTEEVGLAMIAPIFSPEGGVVGLENGTGDDERVRFVLGLSD